MEDIKAGKVDVLISMGANPVYEAPADLGFEGALQQFSEQPGKQVIQLSIYRNETTDYCHWHIPETHYLESWGDVRAFNGTVSIIQPLILPLYQSKSAYELLSILAGRPAASGYEIVRAYWSSQNPAGDFEAWWKTAVQKGVIDGSMSPDPMRAKWMSSRFSSCTRKAMLCSRRSSPSFGPMTPK